MPTFRGDPPGPERALRLAVPPAPTRPGLVAGQFHPQQPREIRAQRPASGADALQQDDGCGWQFAYRPEAPGRPVVRGVARRRAAAQRLDHLVQQAGRPAEELLVRRDVVEVQYGRAAQGRGQPFRERGLPGARVPVDADQADGAGGGRQPAQVGGEIVNGWSRVWWVCAVMRGIILGRADFGRIDGRESASRRCGGGPAENSGEVAEKAWRKARRGFWDIHGVARGKRTGIHAYRVDSRTFGAAGVRSFVGFAGHASGPDQYWWAWHGPKCWQKSPHRVHSWELPLPDERGVTHP